MIPSAELNKIRETLQNSKNILVILPQKPSIDAAAAALSLSLALEKKEKNVQVVCQEVPTVELSGVMGAGKIANQISGGNLVISIDYVEGSIEKVSYNLEGDKFNLVVHTPSDAAAITADKIHYTHSGLDADCLVVVGCATLSETGGLLSGDPGLVERLPLINLDYHANNTQFGKMNGVDFTATSCCEVVFSVLRVLPMDKDPDIAKNLYAGISAATNNFQHPQISAEAFEAVAWCLRHGGRPAPVVDRPSMPQATKFVAPAAPGSRFGSNQQSSASLLSSLTGTLPQVSKLGSRSPFNQRPVGIDNNINQRAKPALVFGDKQQPPTEQPTDSPPSETDQPNTDFDPTWMSPPKVYRGSSES